MLPESQTPATPLDVVIAEDSPTQAALLFHLLEGYGYQVRATTNGQAALNTVRERKPFLVISDVMMPLMTGYQLCKAIKSDSALKDLPVILVTSLSSPQDVINGLDCGADFFIRKPYDEKYLLSRIQYLQANRSARQKEQTPAGVEIFLGGQRYFITAERQQILDLLISTYDEAIHLNERLEYSNQTLNGLYRIAEGLNQAASIADVCQIVLERAVELPGVQAGWITLREGETTFRVAATYNLPAAMEAPGVLDGTCACRAKLMAGELGEAQNILDCERLHASGANLEGLRHHASIPLWVSDQIFGILNLAGADEGLFTSEDLKILNGVGNQVGIALERAHLREHLEQMVVERTQALTAENLQRQRVEEQLRATLVKLEANVRELQDFAYVASHDLQEPLRKIQAFGDRLALNAGEHLDEKNRDYLSRMQNAAKRMQTLISDLLIFSRVTTKAQPFLPINLNSVLKDVLSDLELRIEQTGGQVEVADLPTIDADATQMHQVFQNLIANALKFHKLQVAPQVQVRARLVGEDCLIEVADNGIGFEEKYLDRIFTVFQRLHGRSEYEGTGIGLAVVRKIVDRHGGNVTAHSQPDQGATFIVTLPVHHAQ